MSIVKCKLTKTQQRYRDRLLRQVRINNAFIDVPSNEFWNKIKTGIRMGVILEDGPIDEAGANYIRENTSYIHSRFSNGESFVSLENPSLSGKTTNAKVVSELVSCCGMKPSELEERVHHVWSNSRAIQELIRLDIQGRFGDDYQGYYPFGGLDIDFVYMLGGNWLFNESFDGENIRSRLVEMSQYGESVFRRVTLSWEDFYSTPAGLKDIVPDIILVKNPARDEQQVLNLLSQRIAKPTMVISTETFYYHEICEDLLGIEGLKEILGSSLYIGNSLLLPVSRFCAYEIEPK